MEPMEEMDNRGVMQFFIERGADVNAKNHFGFTPLHCAVLHRNRGVIDILIEAGADINAKSCLKRTALHFAISNYQSKKFKRVLPSDGGGPDMWIVETLLDQQDIRVNVRDIRGDTPLMWAVMDKQLDVIMTLLRCDANPNIQNKDSLTPLHVAMSAQDPCRYIVVALLFHRASINITDKQGNTPIDILIQKVIDTQSYEFAYECLETIAFTHRIKRFQKQKLESIPELLLYLKDCSMEVLRMKIDFVANGMSVFRFMLLGADDSNFENPIFEVYVPIVKRLLSWIYPKYLRYILGRVPKLILCIIYEFINFSKNCEEMLDIDSCEVQSDITSDNDVRENTSDDISENTSDNDGGENTSDNDGCENTSDNDDCENTSDNNGCKNTLYYDCHETSNYDDRKAFYVNGTKKASDADGCEKTSDNDEYTEASNSAFCKVSIDIYCSKEMLDNAGSKEALDNEDSEKTSNNEDSEKTSNNEDSKEIPGKKACDNTSDNYGRNHKLDNCNGTSNYDSFRKSVIHGCEKKSGIHRDKKASNNAGCKEASYSADSKEVLDTDGIKVTCDIVCFEKTLGNDGSKEVSNDGSQDASIVVGPKEASNDDDSKEASDDGSEEEAHDDSNEMPHDDSNKVPHNDASKETLDYFGSEEILDSNGPDRTSNIDLEVTLNSGYKESSNYVVGGEASHAENRKAINYTNVDPRDFFSKVDIFILSKYLSRLDIFCLVVALSKGNIHQCMQHIRDRDNIR